MAGNFKLDGPALRQDMIVAGVLEHLTSISNAQKVYPLTEARDGNPPAVAFGTKQKDGSMAYGPGITVDSIRQVQISIDGNHRHFKQIAVENGIGPNNTNGFSASAWMETDRNGTVLSTGNGKSDIRLCYPGYKDGHLNETKSLFTVELGGLNPQVHQVKGFVDKVIDLVGKDRIDAISIGSHSMGASNALASHFYLQCIGVNSSAILIEPWGASLAVNKLKENLSNPATALAKSLIPAGTRLNGKQIEAMLVKDTVSIRAAAKEHGVFHPASHVGGGLLSGPGISAVNNEMVGKNVLLDMGDSKNITDHWFDPYHLLINVVYQLMTHPDHLIVVEPKAASTHAEAQRARNQQAASQGAPQGAWVAAPLHDLLSPGRAPA